MRNDLSPKRNIISLIEAFRGSKAVRDEHRRSVDRPITVRSGLTAIHARWPNLRSPNKSAPVFIFSAGWRSGSTLLQRWIMTNEDILVWGEPYRRASPISSLANQLPAFTRNWPADHFFSGYDDGQLNQTWVANYYPAISALMNAHIAYLERLFLESAVDHGRKRWGLKEVTLAVEDAMYLQWLFPNARFLFLYRDPYHAYSSYRKWRNWYRTWPNQPVFTATAFGALWKGLVTDFVDNHQAVGGVLLRYEDLTVPATQARLEDYLGFELAEISSLKHIGGRGDARTRMQKHWVPKLEIFLLKRQVEPVSSRLGYQAGS